MERPLRCGHADFSDGDHGSARKWPESMGMNSARGSVTCNALDRTAWFLDWDYSQKRVRKEM